MDNTGPDAPRDQQLPPNPYQPVPGPVPPPGGPAGPFVPPPFVSAPKTNTLAIVSFVSSFFIGLVAIITGHIALGQIRARGELGRGFALAGLIIGYFMVAVTSVLVVLLIVFASAIGAFLVAIDSNSSSLDGGSPTSSPSSAPTPESTAPLPTGQLGAADFDGGYLEFGTGAVIVDEYVDPMCPFCAQFETTNGELLAAGVESGVITLRVHALTFLDRLSEGTNYSSRASAALTCQATLNPDHTLEFLSSLFANQPSEQTAGLSNGALSALATGGASIADCVESGDYEGWSQQNTETALAGPIDGAEIPAVSGTPTVLVDGVLYTGSLTDTAEFSAFVAGAF
ncbi:thioredoxin domain-containing protein [Cryobacterium sp. PH31-L1]|uniref:thioredoxin domain-containing protein n=1 Tax=Cryobacterium sp. PH31-L1 TaxID=3046199 RepID=UPI0024BA5CF7|nr:thioredoxin domain-containing protein [Cryobacterium sp. PH31-L1]MDJ0377821.1 thioredoxin domain-containing protein [Cryobacterium sp. PH31-L1]